MTTARDVAELVNRMPDPDKHGKLDGPAWGDAGRNFDAILALGAEGVTALAGMLNETDDGRDYKVRWTLNGIAQDLLRKKDPARRRMYVDALAATLAAAPSKNATGFIIRTLHVVGDAKAVKAIGALLLDPVNHEYAAQALLAIKDGAVTEFRRALPDAKGAPRMTILQALGVLRDGDSRAAFRAACEDGDAEVRMVGRWALANLGDEGSIDLLLKGAENAKGWERIKSTAYCMLLADRLVQADRKDGARKVWSHLRDTRRGDDAHVCDAAKAALADLK